MISTVVVSLLITLGIFIGLPFLIRELARIPFRWIFVPANTFVLIVTEDEGADTNQSGGNVVDVLHSIPGRKLVKRDDSGKLSGELEPMDWRFEKCESDPTHKNFLFERLGIQDMGSIFYKPRTNSVKLLRYARKIEEDDYQTIAKGGETRFVFHSGHMTVSIRESDTKDKLGLDMEIDLIFERESPVRSILRLPDANAFLSSMIEEIVNNRTGSDNAEAYIGGTDSAKKKRELAKAIEKSKVFKITVFEQIGLVITSVNLRSVSMGEKHRKLLELEVEAEKNASAALIRATNEAEQEIKRAEGRKVAKILTNDADADHITRVILPTAVDELTVRVREAEAYENNQVVTTSVRGGNTGLLIGGK